MTRIQTIAFACMIFGIIVAIFSATADVMGGSDWWHLGTAIGAGIFTYGFTMSLLDRRGYYRRPGR